MEDEWPNGTGMSHTLQYGGQGLHAVWLGGGKGTLEHTRCWLLKATVWGEDGLSAGAGL
jgi:hypothetical protein